MYLQDMHVSFWYKYIGDITYYLHNDDASVDGTTRCMEVQLTTFNIGKIVFKVNVTSKLLQ
jgi:hypothetical protein